MTLIAQEKDCCLVAQKSSLLKKVGSFWLPISSEIEVVF